jgi:hypothetical protein
MMARGTIRRRVLAVALAASTAMPGCVGWARDPEPPVIRVPLEPMGFEALSEGFLVAGSSMLTVDFVDNDHLLVTFGVRRLMKREVNPPPDDDDRVVAAALVELPTGKVLARTEWRFHDRGQYLWNIGHGRFVLRVHDELTTIAPLRNLNTDDPFREMQFLHIDRHIVAIVVSADDDLMTIESTKPGVVLDEDGAPASQDSKKQDPAPVQVNFYRLANTGDAADALRVSSSGAIRTRDAVDLPITTSGFLDVLESGRGQWLFHFTSHMGSGIELSPFDTSCFPHATFVGHGEFVAFGCRGSDDKQELGGFNLKGEEMWQTNFTDTHIYPTFAFAPAAGRFALGRLVTADGSASPVGFLAPTQVGAQEVRVLQSYDGRELLRVDCTPVERAGGNFALSPDGMRLAVVRERTVHHAGTKEYEAYDEVQTAVEVLALPPLNATDKAAVEEDEAAAPADRGARIDLALMRVAGVTGADDGGSAKPPAVAVPAPPVQAAATADAGGEQSAAGGNAPIGNGVAWGDPQPDPERKKPTLYGPGEGAGKPE